MKTIKFLSIFLFLIIFSSGTVKAAKAATYYVATNGSDSNPGTISKPFRTIQKGVNSTNTGDTTYVRGGTYHEAITITNSGTSSSPITLSGYPGEKPIIDGQYILPSNKNGPCDPVSGNCRSWDPLVSIEGNFIIFDNFEIKRSTGRGVRIWPNNNNVVSNSSIHNVWGSAILAQESDNNSIENNKVWLAASFAPYPRSASTLDWPGGIALQRTNNITVVGNEVFNVWGEGIIPMNSKNITIKNNIVYNNFAVNIYLATVEGVTIQRNLVYNTNSEPFLRGGNPSGGIVFATESQDAGAHSSNQTVINNIVVGHSQNIAWWGEGVYGALINTLIANNTLINATVNRETATNLFIDSTAAHNNVWIINNVIVQNTPGNIANVPNNSAFSFSNNLWSKTPEADAQGSGDIIANPKLVNANATLSPGNVDPNWYTLTSTSPAINSAVKLTEVFSDYFGAARGNNPDMGAHEYDGIPQLTITPTITHPPTLTHTPTPTTSGLPGDANGDEVVDIKDYSVWTNQYGDVPMPDPSGNADFNNDSQVNGQDYVIWLNNYSGHLLVEASYN